MRGGIFTPGQGVRAWRLSRCRFALRGDPGFTVIEVLMVLAISGALFVSAVVLISGRQNRTAFEESARQVQSQIQQVLNEVATGYYPNNGNFECTAAFGNQPPNLSAGSSAQGANSGCIFAGKALQFKVAGTEPEEFAVYTVAGLKKGAAGGGESASLADARPVLVAPGSSQANSNYPDNSADERLQHGLTVARMWYRDGAGADHDTGAVAFINSFAGYSGSGELLSGSGNVDIVAADNAGATAGLGVSKLEMVDALNNSGGDRLVSGAVNPPGGVFICFESGTTQDYAILQIGGASRDLDITLHIKDKAGVACTYP